MAVVLVTGGAGFLGTWVLRELFDNGHEPIVFDIRDGGQRWDAVLGRRTANVVFVQGDLCDADAIGRAMDEHRVENVIHLAALLTPQCHDNPVLGCRVNVLGTVALFDQVRQRREQISRISWASSLAVFGPIPESTLRTEVIDETHAPDFYGAFKRSAELIAVQYWKQYRVSSLGIRPHVIYGPERTEGLTAAASLAAKAVALGQPAKIDYTGICGYDFVEDAARAMVRAAFEGPAGAHVVDLPGQEARPADLISAFQSIDASADVTFGGPNIPSNKPPNPTPISRLFPEWKATSLEDGLRRTVDFYRS